VTGAFSQPPQTFAAAAPGVTPYMIGDLPAGSYARSLLFVTAPAAFGLAAVQPPPTRNNPNPPPILVPRLVPPQVVGLVAPIPQVGRGAFKIDENESPRPVDRVFLTYNYFDGVGRSIPGFPGFNLHRETYGFETTFLDGDASVGLRMNSLQLSGDGNLGSGFGDLTAITKYALVNNRATGDVLSAGLAVTAPTGRDAVLLDGSRLNPVLLQPYTGFIYNLQHFYLHGFSSLVIPTDGRDVLLSTESLGVGYRMYQADDPGNALLTYVIPTIEGHATIPLNHHGLDSVPVGFPDTFVLTNGVHIGLGRRSNLTLGVAVPLTGPRPFDAEGIVQLNVRF
jgi:hypothetical protein